MTWPIKPLSELCTLAVDCVNKTAPVVDYPTPYKMIRTTNVKNGFIDTNDVRYVTEATFEKWTRRSRPQYGDVILTREAPVGEVGRCTFGDNEQIFLGQRLFQYRPNQNLLDWNYLAYILQSPRIQSLLHGKSFGATVPHIKVGVAEHLEIPCPPIEEQQKIGSLLANYDDLIETNRRRIDLLEESARLLYREWFVNLRFPGYESVKYIDGLPEGWIKMELSSLATIEMGQSPESKYYNTEGEGLPFHQGVSDFGEHFITHRVHTTVATKKAKAGDILCSVRAPVGRLNLTHDDIAIGRGLAAIRSLIDQQALLFYQLKALFIKEDMIGGGTIFSSVGKKELFSQKILQPDPMIASEFEQFANDVLSQIEVLTMQNRLLIDVRDELLPKLMSGAIQV